MVENADAFAADQAVGVLRSPVGILNDSVEPWVRAIPVGGVLRATENISGRTLRRGE